jgi:hypothetical protein
MNPPAESGGLQCPEKGEEALHDKTQLGTNELRSERNQVRWDAWASSNLYGSRLNIST